ncbi:MAG: hypothetical protein JNK78_17320 [Planctomycetes bacterium]|nr:hypothetical protein [Planctomycetota bacterium]
MAKRREVSACAFCGAPDGVTDDHLPPRGCFPAPVPADRITVPCCERCRLEWGSKDDEHFRNVLHCAEWLENDPRSQAVRDVIGRSFQRPEGARYAEGFVAAMEDVFTPDGNAEEKVAVPLDDRVSRVVERIARGIYWRELRRPVPRTHIVERAQLDQYRKNVEKVLGRIGQYARGVVRAWNGQFQYVFIAEPTVGEAFFTCCFFGRAWALAFIRRRRT